MAPAGQARGSQGWRLDVAAEGASSAPEDAEDPSEDGVDVVAVELVELPEGPSVEVGAPFTENWVPVSTEMSTPLGTSLGS